MLQRNDITELTAFVDQLTKYPREVGTIDPIISPKDLQDIFNKTKTPIFTVTILT